MDTPSGDPSRTTSAESGNIPTTGRSSRESLDKVQSGGVIKSKRSSKESLGKVQSGGVIKSKRSSKESLGKVQSGGVIKSKRSSKESLDKAKSGGAIKDKLWEEQIRLAVEESRKNVREDMSTQTQKHYAKVTLTPSKVTQHYYDQLNDEEFYRLKPARPDLTMKAKSVGTMASSAFPYPDSSLNHEPTTYHKLARKKTVTTNLPGDGDGDENEGEHDEDNEGTNLSKGVPSKQAVDDGGNVLSYFDPKYVKPEYLPMLAKSRNIVVGQPSEVLKKYFGYNDFDEFPEEFQHDDTSRAFILPKKFWKDYDEPTKDAAPSKALPFLQDAASKALAAKKEEEERKKRGFVPDEELIQEFKEETKRPDALIPRQPKNVAVEYLGRQPFQKHGMTGSTINDASPKMLEHWEMKPLDVDAGGHLRRDASDRRWKISEVTGTPVKVAKKEQPLTDDKRPWYHDVWADRMNPEFLDKNPEFTPESGYPPEVGPHRSGRPDHDDRGHGRHRGGPGGGGDGEYSDGSYGSEGSGYSCTCGMSDSLSSSGSSGGSEDSEEDRKKSRKKHKKHKKHGHKKRKGSTDDEESEESTESDEEGSTESGSDEDKKRKKYKKSSKKEEKGSQKDMGEGDKADESTDGKDKKKKKKKKKKKGKGKGKGDEEKTKKDAGTDAFPETVPAWAPDAWKSPEGFKGWFFKHNKNHKGSISTPDIALGQDVRDKDWFRAYYMLKRAQADGNVDEIKELLGDSESAQEFLRELEEEWLKTKEKEQEEEDPMTRLPRDEVPTAREYPEHSPAVNLDYYKSYPLYPTISNERYFEWFKDVDRLEDPRARRRPKRIGFSKSANHINWDDPKEAAKWYAYGYRRPNTKPKPERADYDTKDFIYDNARSIVLQPPRRPVPRYIDDRKGTTHLLEPSGLVQKFIFRDDFGRIPEYLIELNEELGRPGIPDFDKFYRPHRCKFLHGHIHCKMCMRPHPRVKPKKMWNCDMTPYDYGPRDKYRECPEDLTKCETHNIKTQPDYSEHFDINNLIQRLVLNNQVCCNDSGIDRGRQQNFFNYYTDNNVNNTCFANRSPPVYV